jgi:hypothetical protein
MRVIHTSMFLALGSFLALAGCGDTGPAGDPDPVDGVIQIAGAITQDATWEGAVHLTGEATIESGVTVTIAAGTSFEGAKDAILRVYGALHVAGTEAAPVTMFPLSGAPTWGGITVESGGEARIAYARGEDVASLLYCREGALFCGLESVEFTSIGNAMITNAPSSIEKSTLIELANGGVTVGAGGDLTVIDSYVLTSTHDLIVTTAGSRLTVDHSEIGGAQGSYEHCNFHIGGADYISITNSNIISSVYAMMIGSTSNAVIQYNNIADNENDIADYNNNTAVDMRYNYWSRGAPALGSEFDTSAPAAAYYDQAGPRI